MTTSRFRCGYLEGGHRVAYELPAVAYEEAHEMEGYSRGGCGLPLGSRAAAGNQRTPPRLLLFVLFCLLSHKTGRLIVPVFMVVR